MGFDFDELEEQEAHPWREADGNTRKGPASLEERAALIQAQRARERAQEADRVQRPPPMQVPRAPADRFGADQWHGRLDMPAPESEEEEPVKEPKGPPEWQERKGFRFRAADEKCKAENARIQQADEEVYRKLRREKRAAAREVLKHQPGGQLGSAEGGPAGMQEARLSLVERLERESDPNYKRRQRKEEEQRQRDEEKRQREEEEQKRLEERIEQHRRQQQQQAEQARDLGEAKRSHWQAWDEQQNGAARAGAGAAPSSSQATAPAALAAPAPAPVAPAPAPASRPPAGFAAAPADPAASSAHGSPLLGRWLYGSKPSEYCISATEHGRLRFEGPHPSGSRVTGVLASRDGWLQAELLTAGGEHFGTMRFRFVPEDGTVLSNFRKTGKADWGKDNIACRAAAAAVPARPAAVAPAAAGVPHTAAAGADWHCQACTLRNPPSASVCSACGLPRPRGGPVLTLDLSQPAEAGAPTSADCPAMESAEPPGSGAAAEAEPEGLLGWLQAHRLESFHGALLEQGFEEVEDLRAAGQSVLDGTLQTIGAKPGHRVRFRRALFDAPA